MATTSREATIGGVSMKHISLVTLTVQNSALILIMRYSRVMPLEDGKRYSPATAVLLNEILKLIISSACVMYTVWPADSSYALLPSGSTATPPNSAGSPRFTPSAVKRFFSSFRTGDSLKLAIPAALYTVQNTLQYVAVSNLDAATFQVTYQLKILTTALFSVTMLGRVLSRRQWISLVLLMIGVAAVQLPSSGGSESAPVPPPAPAPEGGAEAPGTAARLARRDGDGGGDGNQFVGLVAVIVACAISGLAGVYFEKVLKDSSKNVSLWVRNVQLSFFSLFPAVLLCVFGSDARTIQADGFFGGYNWVVWMAILCQAAGGIIVALVVNYADNIAKNFATSLSIILSFIASVYFFGLKITIQYLVGTAIVLFATYLYSSPTKDKAAESYSKAATQDPDEISLEDRQPRPDATLFTVDDKEDDSDSSDSRRPKNKEIV